MCLRLYVVINGSIHLFSFTSHSLVKLVTVHKFTLFAPTSFGTDKIFCYASHPKIGGLIVIHAKNDAKEEEKEEEKENVGIFSPNSSFFGNQKNLKRKLNLIFF